MGTRPQPFPSQFCVAGRPLRRGLVALRSGEVPRSGRGVCVAGQGFLGPCRQGVGGPLSGVATLAAVGLAGGLQAGGQVAAGRSGLTLGTALFSIIHHL